MGRFTLIVGGARSGKSRFALNMGEKVGKDRIFVATARATDPEMKERILKHRLERGPLWETFEEPLDVASLLGSLPAGAHVVVIDCLTVLLSNLMIEKMYEDEELLREMESLTSAIHESRFPIIAIANEVGMGLVPAEPMGRRFRDLAGMVNQRLAEAADEVFLITAGIPLCLKRGGGST